MGGPAIVSSGRTTYEDVPNNTHASWWRDPCLRLNVIHCIGLCASSWMQGYDLSLFNGLQSITPWQEFFDHPTGTKLGIMNACITVIASPLTELVCTRYGRRPAVWLGALIAIAGSIVNAAANGLGMYIAGRVIIGDGTACALTGAPVLLQELAHPRYRAKIAGMFTSCQYTAGILSSWLCFGTLHIRGNRSWRIPCYVQVVGPAVILLLTITAPESPRWLVSRGRSAEARQILAKCHANGDSEDPLVNLEFHEIEAAIELDEVSTRKTYLDLFRTSANRRRIMVAWIVGIGTNWVGNGIISYYLTPVLNSLGVVQPVKTELINCGLQVWNLILSTGASILCERTGRRPLWLTSTTGMLFSFVIVMALSATFAKTGEKSTGLAVVPFLYNFFGFYDIAWTPLTYSYPIEIMPFDIRSKAMTAYLIVQQLALFVNQLVNPIILDAIGWKYYGVYIAILSILIVIEYFFFPETKGLTVEEIGLIFETGRKGDRLLAANQLRAKMSRSEDVDGDTQPATSPKVNVSHIA